LLWRVAGLKINFMVKLRVMDLETAFTKYQPRSKGCPVDLLLESLDEKNRKVLKNAIDGKIPTYLIAKTVRSEGLKLSEGSIVSHRKGDCKCATK